MRNVQAAESLKHKSSSDTEMEGDSNSAQIKHCCVEN